MRLVQSHLSATAIFLSASLQAQPDVLCGFFSNPPAGIPNETVAHLFVWDDSDDLFYTRGETLTSLSTDTVIQNNPAFNLYYTGASPPAAGSPAPKTSR